MTEKVVSASESLFRPANGLWSTCSLVEIHNKCNHFIHWIHRKFGEYLKPVWVLKGWMHTWLPRWRTQLMYSGILPFFHFQPFLQNFVMLWVEVCIQLFSKLIYQFFMSGFNKIVTKLLNESKKTINFTDKEWQFNPPTPPTKQPTPKIFPRIFYRRGRGTQLTKPSAQVWI